MITLKTMGLVAFGCALSGGVVGALTVRSLGNPESAELRSKPAAPKHEATPQANDVADLDARVTELEDRMALLSSQQRSQQAFQKLAQALAAEGKPGERASHLEPAANPESPAFEVAVRSVLERVDWEKEEERAAMRDQRRDERMQRQTALLTSRLKLTPEQTQAVAAALELQADRFRQLRQDNSENQEPVPRSEWRTRMQEIRRQTEAELRQTLTEDQLTQYRAVSEEEGFGPGRFGREREAPASAASGQ